MGFGWVVWGLSPGGRMTMLTAALSGRGRGGG